MIAGTLLIHLEMYKVVNNSKCDPKYTDLSIFVDRWARIICIIIFSFRSLQDFLMIGMFIWLFLYFYKHKKQSSKQENYLEEEEEDQGLTCLEKSILAAVVLLIIA